MSTNLVKTEQGIGFPLLESYEIIEKPVGKGFAYDKDSTMYKDYIEDLHLDPNEVITIFYFENDLPYYIGDVKVLFYNQLNREIFDINETQVIRFEDYPIVLLNDNESIQTAISNKRLIK